MTPSSWSRDGGVRSRTSGQRHGAILSTYRTRLLYSTCMATRICSECGHGFQSSHGELRCWFCRSHNLCACGEIKKVHSATCYACRNDSGASNGHWRGGRTRHKRGYVMVLSTGHPRAGKGSYVFEHVLVMEKRLAGISCPERTFITAMASKTTTG